MPWEQVSTVDQRLQFVADCERGIFSMSELCARYGISRQTGYETLARYKHCGPAGLAPQSRRPRRSPDATPSALVTALLALRRRYPDFGPKKLLRMLRDQQPEASWPARSTAALILKRHALVAPGRRRRAASVARPAIHPAATAPNDVWSVDFKGEFRTGDGQYCYPLTVTDRYSRYVLDCFGMLAPTTATTRSRFDRIFREYGVPRVMRSDNGRPFASTGLAGLSRLSVWWLQLGIQLDRIQPGHPEENGSHEYMHRVLKRWTTRPPAANCRGQQSRFDDFRQVYNHIRPHESLDQAVPASLYQPSPRPLPVRVPSVEYPGHFEVRRVLRGCFSWHGQPVFLTHVLNGFVVGLEAVDDGLWTVHFCHQPLGRFDERTKRVVGTNERARA